MEKKRLVGRRGDRARSRPARSGAAAIRAAMGSRRDFEVGDPRSNAEIAPAIFSAGIPAPDGSRARIRASGTGRAGRTLDRFPCHVTLRVRDGIPSLRTVSVVREVERTFAGACERARLPARSTAGLDRRAITSLMSHAASANQGRRACGGGRRWSPLPCDSRRRVQRMRLNYRLHAPHDRLGVGAEVDDPLRHAQHVLAGDGADPLGIGAARVGAEPVERVQVAGRAWTASRCWSIAKLPDQVAARGVELGVGPAARRAGARAAPSRPARASSSLSGAVAM